MEAEGEASRLVPAAEAGIQSACQAAMTLCGQPQELTLPYVHDLAASQLHSWLASQKDVSAFQVHAPEGGRCPNLPKPPSLPLMWLFILYISLIYGHR